MTLVGLRDVRAKARIETNEPDFVYAYPEPCLGGNRAELEAFFTIIDS